MKNTRVGRFLFAIPWLVVACQHFIYASFVETIVPAYMPFRMFWVYFTAIAMIAAGIAIMTGIKARLAAGLLACMMLIFILLVHLPILTGDPHAMNWTRFFQDLSITGIAFILAGAGPSARTVRLSARLAIIGLYLYTIPLLFLGAQHFWQLPYVTGRIPDWLPPKMIWDFLVGAFIILSSLAIILRKKDRQAALALGTALVLLALLYHIPDLIANIYDGRVWTAAMLDSMIASGALLLAAEPRIPG